MVSDSRLAADTTARYQEDPDLSDQKMISIVIPTHNRPALLTEALDSVAQQQYRPVELLVVDDGSEQATQQAVGFIAAPEALVYQREATTDTASDDSLSRRIRDDIAVRERAARELTLRGAIQSYQPAFNTWYRRMVERYGDALAAELANKPSTLVKWASR